MLSHNLELLRDPTAEAVWALLRERYPAEALDLDVDLALDLNVDSFGWMEIAVTLQDRLEIHLTETDIAGIRTIRELLRLAIERRGGAPPAASHARVMAPHSHRASLAGEARRKGRWVEEGGDWRLHQ
jgi:long-chain acyl-CoA synthetase